ncbi:hypothetical protein [Amycolatopsis sp. NPDC059657]|uniref:hypothetical protein n=1 Tax=Amycolatopsis sp. NPDC059657 TaxID=3346899 RepID=UPI00366BCD98
MTVTRKIAVALAVGAMTLAGAVVDVPAASAEGAHTIVLSNKSPALYVSFASRDAAGTIIKYKEKSWPAGTAGGTYMYQVPASAVSTRLKLSRTGLPDPNANVGTDLANTQHWCFRADRSGRIDQIKPCDPNG